MLALVDPAVSRMGVGLLLGGGRVGWGGVDEEGGG
uniref:Uncharacterized protein n=1 Tax=Arundo donax TaxID=35708 RepID=A0A0A9NCK4_ARUDO